MKPSLRTLLKTVAWLCAGLVAVAGAGLAYVYYTTNAMLRRTYDVPFSALSLPADEASLTEGRRLATLRGCFGGCHGKSLAGQVWDDNFVDGHMVSPDLTRVVQSLPVEVFARVVREGVRANGESVWGMPSAMFFHLTDQDLAAIIAFLRSQPAQNGLTRVFEPGPRARWDMARGDWLSAREEILRLGPRMPSPDPADTIATGRYLARTVCSECHGADLTGSGDTPNLRVVAGAYSPEHFARLMQTGIAVGDRQLGLMAVVARTRFSHFRPDEVAAVYAFLKSPQSVR
jgi:mono/diheme cytochrome c family protein